MSPLDATAGIAALTRDVRSSVDNVGIDDEVLIAARSVIAEDVPLGALAIARARQVDKEGRGGKRDD